ncbi:MAG: class I SAM-dependent methyltransferase [Thermoplasmata archaeon]|nr:class I SAM-dependent methyltransferase [Thermoplasmata archaeon]MCI4341679.1 class I SAM-dependent methyltransferase [Thermoplasmata archaeon]
MGDALEARFAGRFTGLDLGCGPGSLSARLLQRFPNARMVAVDFDPVLTYLGRRTLGDAHGRLAWIEADLRLSSWIAQLPVRRVQAVLSTTALHWLPARRTIALYRELAKMLVPRGLFLNGEHLPFDRSLPQLARLADSAARVERRRYLDSGAALDWGSWWKQLREVPELAARFALRDERYPGGEHHEHDISTSEHVRWLRAAGFAEAGVLWQQMDDFVIAGVR